MIGAIIGDIAGSYYEFGATKDKNFVLFPSGSDFTDDSIMTIAVSKALIGSRLEKKSFRQMLVQEMQHMGRLYPHPTGGYGARFSGWLAETDPKPYGSYGNGSAMRVSPCGIIAVTLEEALNLAKASAEVTHNHPEGIKGAQATAAAIFLAEHGKTKAEIRDYIHGNFYPMDRTLEDIRPEYYFNESCQGTVPEAIIAFLESENFEDAIRNAVSLGGDADTIGAITGAIAWSFYREEEDPTKEEMLGRILHLLPEDFKRELERFRVVCIHRKDTYDRLGNCSEIIL